MVSVPVWLRCLGVAFDSVSCYQQVMQWVSELSDAAQLAASAAAAGRCGANDDAAPPGGGISGAALNGAAARGGGVGGGGDEDGTSFGTETGMALDASSNGRGSSPHTGRSASSAGASGSTTLSGQRTEADVTSGSLEGAAGARPLVEDPLSVVLTMRDAGVQAYVAVVRNVLASKQVGWTSRLPVR